MGGMAGFPFIFIFLGGEIWVGWWGNETLVGMEEIPRQLFQHSKVDHARNDPVARTVVKYSVVRGLKWDGEKREREGERRFGWEGEEGVLYGDEKR